MLYTWITKTIRGYKMKKFLTIVLLCLISFGIFAEHRPIGRSISVRVRTGSK